MYTVWEEKEDLSWDNVLDKLSDIGPVFPCNAESIDILSTPNEFYESLIENASRANDRILLSTLYIGQGEREQNLVQTIENTLQRNPDLQFSMIMDCSRATRNINTNQSSLHTLLPLFNHDYDNNVNIHLFRSPNLKGIWSLFPERSKEVAGVHHMKAFIFDNTLIISGANLNETYLSNRQDRYIVFKDNEVLTNHVYEMMQTLGGYCPNVAYNEQAETFDIDMNINKKKYRLNEDNQTASIYDDIDMNVEEEPSKWIDFVSKRLWPFTRPNERKRFDDSDTFVIMSTQMMDKIQTDSQMTSCLLSMPNIDLKIGTAYFNLAHKYNQILLNTYSQMYERQSGHLQILTASEQCNSFYKASGLAGYVTPLYEHFAKQFESAIDAIQHHKNSDDKAHLFKFHRYGRDDWTYHCKGIWIDFEEPFSLTMIGSSNYGERSVHKDSEMNFTILTKNESLRTRLKDEWNNLIKHSNKNENDSEESAPYLVGLLGGLVRNFM